MDEYRKCVNCAKFFSMRKKIKKSFFRYTLCMARCDWMPQIKNFEESFLKKDSKGKIVQKST